MGGKGVRSRGRNEGEERGRGGRMEEGGGTSESRADLRLSLIIELACFTCVHDEPSPIRINAVAC